MSETVQWLVGVAAGLTASGVIWRKFLHPMIRGANTIADATPVLLEIAAEFKPNSGGSLRDVVEAIRGDIAGHATQEFARMDVMQTNMADHIEADRVAIAEIKDVLAEIKDRTKQRRASDPA